MICRIAVLVSGGGTNLQALLDAQEKGILKSGKIELVISNKKDAYALKRAEDHQIPAYVVSGKEDHFEDKMISLLEEYHIDLIVLAGYLVILSKKFTSHFAGRIINIHPALIPSFCGKGFYGLKVHEAALEYGVKVTGATVHYVDEVPDGGQIIAQRAVYIQDGDTPEVLQKRVMEQAEWIILPEAAEKVSREIIGKKGQ